MKNEMRSNQLYFMKSNGSSKCSNISVWSFFFMFCLGLVFEKQRISVFVKLANTFLCLRKILIMLSLKH